jgi:hypothetical protein
MTLANLCQSVDTVSYLFCVKIKYPDHSTLFHGNHESAALSHHFGLREEVLQQYRDDVIWPIDTDTFDRLPLAAFGRSRHVGTPFLCVHGSLSPRFKKQM